MIQSKLLWTIGAVVILQAAVAVAADPDYTVQFNLRATPGEPMSAVTHRIILGLMEDSRSGDDIGWHVTILTVRELDGQGEVVRTWSMANPFVDTADGLWWITHNDADNPMNSEFTMPPRIVDTIPHAGSEPALDFELVGETYSSQSPPFADTGSLTYRLAEENETEPIKEEEEEEIEIPFEPESPYAS